MKFCLLSLFERIIVCHGPAQGGRLQRLAGRVRRLAGGRLAWEVASWQPAVVGSRWRGQRLAGVRLAWVVTSWRPAVVGSGGVGGS
jgi:hypothetical protein